MTATRHSRQGIMLAILLVGPFMAQADATIANVATPSIHADLGASGAMLELVIGGYLTAAAVLVITGARLGRTHGYRRIFVLGGCVFTGASLLCGLAADPTMLVLARVLQGFGAALMFPQTLTGIQLTFAGRHRSRAIALYAVALSAGAVVGQVLGGALISADVAGTQWRAIFLVNVPVGAVTIVAALRYLPKDARLSTPTRLDGRGVAALSVSLLLLVLPLALGRSEGWPTWTWLCLGASVPAVLVFAATERRVAADGGAPLVDLTVLARPAVRWALVTLMAATGTYYALLFTLAQYLQQGLGRSPLASGLTVVPWVAAFGLAGVVVHRLPDRARPHAPLAGCLLLAAAYTAISVMLFTGHHGETPLVVLLAFGGLGLGIEFNALIMHLTSAVPAGYAADISGVSTTTMQVGAALCVAALGTLYLDVDAQARADHATHAFAVTAAVLAAVAVLAAAAARRAISPARSQLIFMRMMRDGAGSAGRSRTAD